MRRYIRELRPTSVYDLAAMVALYRPGPMDNIPAYIRRKHGQEPVTYLHPLLEPYLEKTYGIFVYQEDIMAAAMALGGFTGPEADTLGYAIRKKKSSVLRAQKEKFVTQAAERGVPAQTIDAVFKAFEPFERYGFNKAHATCYGLVAYQTAYLKANYTVEYMTSVLTAVRDTSEKVAAAIAECRRLGIEVLPPDVHRSDVEFTVEGDAIRFGLLAVKNVGQGAIESIIAARERGRRVPLADRPVLADRPAPGEPEGPRGARPGRAPSTRSGTRPRSCSGSTTRSRPAAPPSATGSPARRRCSRWPPSRPPSTPRCPTVPETPTRERLRWEKELLGLYLSDHPLGEIAEAIGPFVTAYSGDLRDESLDGQRVVVGGIVTGVRMVITKRQATMAIVSLEDLQGAIEVVVFPRLYEETRPTWTEGRILLVAGRVDHKGEDVSLLADLAIDWDDAAARGPEGVRPGRRGGRSLARPRWPPGGRSGTARQRARRPPRPAGPAGSAPGGRRGSRSEPGRGRTGPGQRRCRRPRRRSARSGRRRSARSGPEPRRQPTSPDVEPAGSTGECRPSSRGSSRRHRCRPTSSRPTWPSRAR